MWPDLYSLPVIVALIVLVEEVRGRRSEVTWISPYKGESFGPGDKIPCKWRADEAVVSPSFRLCMISDGLTSLDDQDTDSDMDCGEIVWPTIEQNEDEYTTSLAVPANVTADGNYILRMKDDFGSKFETSSFSLHTSPTGATDSSAPSDGAQVPLGSLGYSSSLSAAGAAQPSDTLNVANASSSATVASTVDSTFLPLAQPSDDITLNPSATASSKTDSSSSRPHTSTSVEPLGRKPLKSEPSKANASSPVSTTSASHAVNTSSLSVAPQDLATRRAPSTAAFAVPLSAIGAILVIAVGLAFRHRRKLGEDRMKDAEKLTLSRQSSINSYKSAGEVQYALDVLSRHEIGYGAAPAPVPLFMPMERENIRSEPRRPTKMAFAPASYAASSPSVKSSESVRTSRSRPLLTRSGLSSLGDVHTHLGSNDAPNRDEDSATHSVLADYVMPSPPLPASLLAAPQRVHIRNEAPSVSALAKIRYDDKGLPLTPRS